MKTFREIYRERRDALLDSLGTALPDSCTWTVPTGGFYVWVTLPEGLDAKAMQARAVAARVAYVPGIAFYADGNGRRNLRLSYCFPPPERIREGVRQARRPCSPKSSSCSRRSAPSRARGTAGPGRRAHPGAGMTELERAFVLAGGLSVERDVSLRSGRRVADALRSRRRRSRAPGC